MVDAEKYGIFIIWPCKGAVYTAPCYLYCFMHVFSRRSLANFETQKVRVIAFASCRIVQSRPRSVSFTFVIQITLESSSIRQKGKQRSYAFYFYLINLLALQNARNSSREIKFLVFLLFLRRFFLGKSGSSKNKWRRVGKSRQRERERAVKMKIPLAFSCYKMSWLELRPTISLTFAPSNFPEGSQSFPPDILRRRQISSKKLILFRKR